MGQFLRGRKRIEKTTDMHRTKEYTAYESQRLTLLPNIGHDKSVTLEFCAHPRLKFGNLRHSCLHLQSLVRIVNCTRRCQAKGALTLRVYVHENEKTRFPHRACKT